MDNIAQSPPPQTGALPRFCSSCGKQLDLGAAFCGNCAARVDPLAGASPAAAPIPDAKPRAAQDWRKYMGVLAVAGGALWKYKFAIYIALRSFSIFARH